jgi:hypothetical protein
MVGMFLLVVVMGRNVVWSTAHPGQHGAAAGAQEAPDQRWASARVAQCIIIALAHS